MRFSIASWDGSVRVPVEDLVYGFRIGERLVGWGVGLREVAMVLGQDWTDEAESRIQRLDGACAATYGLDTIGVEITAAGRNRPVTALRYALAAPPAGPSLPEPALWMDPLMRLLGSPREAANHALPEHGDPAGSVRFYADWPRGDQSVGLSLYGGLRQTAHGPSSGCLWLNWATVPAARPFLADWRARAEALNAEAREHSGIVTFDLAIACHPARADARRAGALARDSDYALHAPQLLPTPQPVADRLGAKGIGFWRSRDHRRWHASTRWDTISFDMDAKVEIAWHDIAPAKGGGFSEIAVEGWSAHDVHGSRAMIDAVAALETISGVTVRRVDGYDC